VLELLELKQRLSELESYKPVRVGEVVAVYPEKAAARVKFLDMDEETSYELPILYSHTYKDKAFWMPRVGEKVVCLMLDLTDGFIVGAFYHRENPTPVANANKVTVVFEDGSTVEYDKSAGRLYLDVKEKLEIVVPETVITSITTHNGNITINGNLRVNGDVIASGDIADRGGQYGTVAILRDTYNGHTHPGDSGGTTGEPNQKVGG